MDDPLLMSVIGLTTFLVFSEVARRVGGCIGAKVRERKDR